MDVREATRDDVATIRRVARESLSESYGHVLPDDVIAKSVERWYGTGELSDELDREDALFLVGVEGDEAVAFAQCYVVRTRDTVGDIDWLHVRPEYRGEGRGTELLDAAEAALRERGADRVEARVIAENERGARFYEEHGYERVGEATVEVGGERFDELRYVRRLGGPAGENRVVARTGPESRRLTVAFDERERGSLGPFFAAYAEGGDAERYGWFCSNCEGFDTAMDAMGRVECNRCGNRRRPTRWDAAYL